MADGSKRKRVLLYDDELPAADRRPGLGFGLPEAVVRDKLTGLSKIEDKFCLRFTTHYDSTRAAMEAGYSPARCHTIARKLLASPPVKQRVAEIEDDRFRRMKFDGDVYLAKELKFADAPITEVLELYVPPCRYCYGKNNEYQRTWAEFQEAFNAWMRMPDIRRPRFDAVTADFGFGEVLAYDSTNQKIPFDQKGGEGYDPTLPPNPACPNCRGRGLEDPNRGTIPYIKLKDSRELSDVGKMMFAGIKNGPRGLEVLVQDRAAAKNRLSGMIERWIEMRAKSAADSEGAQRFGFGVGVGANRVTRVERIIVRPPATDRSGI